MGNPMSFLLSGPIETATNVVENTQEKIRDSAVAVTRLLFELFEDKEMIAALKNVIFPEAPLRMFALGSVLILFGGSLYLTLHYSLTDSDEEKDRIDFFRRVWFGDAGFVHYIMNVVSIIAFIYIIRRAFRVLSRGAIVALQTRGVSVPAINSILGL